MSGGGHPRYAGPVVDAHCHYDVRAEGHVDEVNSANGIDLSISLWDLEWPPRSFADVLESWPATGGRLCHVPDLSTVGAPGTGDRLADELAAAVGAGAVAVKVWKNLGLWLRDVDDRLLAVDDRRLDPMWRAAGELGVPVMIHVGDPPAFFAPLTPDNPRIVDLTAHPDWWFGRGGFPSLAELHSQFERVVRRHPETMFVSVHFGSFMSLDEVERMLATYPNYMLDTAAAIADLGVVDPQRVRDLFVAHADRIVFGTDLVRTDGYDYPVAAGGERFDLSEFFARHWRYFETDLTGLEHPLPAQGDWTVNGIDLPDDVLDRLYHRNAVEWFRL